MNTQQSNFILSQYINYLNEQVQVAQKKSNVYFKYTKLLNDYYEKINNKISNFESIYNNIENFESVKKMQLILDKIDEIMKKRANYYWEVTSPNFMRATTKHIKALETYAQMYFKY